MAGGPLLPASVYLGAASGNLFPSVYVPSSNTNKAGEIEGIGCVASLSSGSTCQAKLQFLLPPSIPTGTAKLRLISLSAASTGKALITVNDAVTPMSTSIANSTLLAETQSTIQWSTATNSGADQLIETKVTLSSTMVAGSILSVRLDFNSTGSFSLAAASVHVPSLIWE